MRFDQDPNEQANISGADLAIMCAEMAQLRIELAAAQEWNERYAIELREIRGQKPAAIVTGSSSLAGYSNALNNVLRTGTKLYASPAPADHIPDAKQMAADHPAQTLDRVVERATLKDAK